MNAIHLMILLGSILFGAACAETLPAHASYVPTDCPTADEADRELALYTRPARTPPTTPTPPEPAPKAAPEEPTPSPPEDTTPSEPADTRVELNTAGAKELESLPGIGPSLAQRIIERRERRAFTRVSQLKRVKGIGRAKYARLKDLVRIEKR